MAGLTCRTTIIIITHSNAMFFHYSYTYCILLFQDSLQLHIFSFLDAEDLCRICCVSRHWYLISCDNVLWQRRLQADIGSWNVISCLSNPDALISVSSQLSNKDMYVDLLCS